MTDKKNILLRPRLYLGEGLSIYANALRVAERICAQLGGATA